MKQIIQLSRCIGPKAQTITLDRNRSLGPSQPELVVGRVKRNPNYVYLSSIYGRVMQGKGTTLINKA